MAASMFQIKPSSDATDEVCLPAVIGLHAVLAVVAGYLASTNKACCPVRLSWFRRSKMSLAGIVTVDNGRLTLPGMEERPQAVVLASFRQESQLKWDIDAGGAREIMGVEKRAV